MLHHYKHHEFGRSRKTGYVLVGQGEEKEERFAAAKNVRKKVKANVLQDYFASLKKSRGATETEFVEKKLQVQQRLYFSFIWSSLFLW